MLVRVVHVHLRVQFLHLLLNFDGAGWLLVPKTLVGSHVISGVDGRDLGGTKILNGGKMGIWTVAQDADMLFQLFNLCLIYGNLPLLRFSRLNYYFKVLVQNFILISLCFNITLEAFIVFPCLDMQLVLHNFRLLDQNIHHDIYLLPDLVGLLLEQLQQVVPCDKLVLQGLNLFIDRAADIVDSL